MRGMAVRFARRGYASSGRLEIAALALLAYVPFLLSSPGKVAADTKQYLYVDPDRFLARVASLWDPHVAAGTVPHQQIGYLFPMGPYYWIMDRAAVPDWIAQRIWMGTISFVAVLGARRLFTVLGARRAGALAGALVYMLTPYQLAFTARMSVLLLPWAGLPWLVGLTMRAIRRDGWKDPAIFALVVLTIGSVNASALVFVLVAPALWMVLEMFGRAGVTTVLRVAGRIALLTIGVSVWWAVGIGLQGAYGLPVLQLTENLRVVSSASNPADLLRGIGNWFFYGRDGFGYSIDQANDYVSNNIVAFYSYGIAILAVASAAVVRWRYRTYFVLLVVVGTVIGVGAWPNDHASLYGQLWRSFVNGSSAGLALRNTARIAPLIVLGIAGLLAAAVSTIADRYLQLGAAGVVAIFAFGALLPVWNMGYLSGGLERSEQLPAYWTSAAAALEHEGNSTRVLEIPGANFSAYRWGNTVEPITPGLIDRPYVAREVLPYGSPQSLNLLDALDRRIQEGTFEPSSLAAIARLLGVGTVVLRSDLAYERFGLPRPRVLWAALTPVPTGLRQSRAFGPVVANGPRFPLVDPLSFRTAYDPDPPPVALFGVRSSVPIVHTAPAREPVVLAGDGDGIVDAAAEGLIDGNQLVLEAASMSDTELRQALARGGDVVITDSNRRRAATWFASLRDNKGATERAGQTLPDPNGENFNLDVFPGRGDESRTVVEEDGGTVDATADGGTARPEDRAPHAFDGDVRTAWRVGGPDPTGTQIVLRTDHGVRADHVTLVQPQDGPRDRVISKVRLRINNGPATTVQLGAASLSADGQVVTFPARTVHRLEITLLQTSVPPFNPGAADAVGFAEAKLGNVRVTETVRMPIDLTRRIGTRAAGHHVDVVMSRLRHDPNDPGRQDEELALRRRFVLPGTSDFGLTGTARVDPNASDHAIDDVLGTGAAGIRYTSSGRLAGDVDTRASRAFDGNPATAWTANLGPQDGQWIEASMQSSTTVDRAELTVVADGSHSVPTQLHLEADGANVHTLTVPPIIDVPNPGARQTFTIPFAPVTAKHLRLVVDSVRAVTPFGDPAHTFPVAIGEADFAGVPTAASPVSAPGTCRDDLLGIDGHAVPVRVTGAVTNARRGLRLEACAGALSLRAGSHTVVSATGLDTGIDLDRIVLSSGGVNNVAPRGAGLGTAGARVRVVSSRSTSVDLQVRTNGTPFWLVFGQSRSHGWTAETNTGSMGPNRLVDGYANGWLVDPGHAGTMSITLRWTPQRLVWIGLAVSAAAVVACITIVLVARRQRRAARAGALPVPQLSDTPAFDSPLSSAGRCPRIWSVTTGAALAIALGTAFFSRLWIGIVAGAASVLIARVPRFRVVVDLAIPTTLALSRLADTPELAWLALALLVVDLAGRWTFHQGAKATAAR